MQYQNLGPTDLKISRICLGTMTWGEQNSEAEAHEQLDYARAQGVNFIDTAELYPVPPQASTYGRTESIIGSWLKARGNRSQIVLASKIAGPSRGEAERYIRGGSRFNREQLRAACHASLKRLQTDYLDLYQLHWPERPVNFFGRLGLDALGDESDLTPLAETLAALDELRREGKIRHYGLSNETPWGVLAHLRAALPGLPLVSVQNPYNLLNRSYEVGLAEISLRENIGLLAYSPLAFGLLSGKYLAPREQWQPDWRLAKFERFQRYNQPRGYEATGRYQEIAAARGLSLTQLALAFVNQRPFVQANIIGATTLEQLRENIASIDVVLDADTLAATDAVHRDISNPCP